MNRSEYLNSADKSQAHRKYYAQFVTEDIKQVIARTITVKRLLESIDEHFNDISLYRWDSIVSFIPNRTALELRNRGDWLSLGTGVCILKEAARQMVEEIRKIENQF